MRAASDFDIEHAPDPQRLERTHAGGVWVVDDSALQAQIVERALSRRYAVTVFENGATMLEVLARTGVSPAVLILDWSMPDISGEEVCRFVRERLNLAQLPILVLTATGTAEGVLEALAAGANDFVRKPFSEPELSARVATLIELASLNTKLLEAQRDLRVEGEFRERFMGMLAHDLRQPLNAIAMASHALAREGTPVDRMKGYLNVQARAAGRMQRMIGELLDFTRSRPESGMPIQRQLTDISRLVHASLEEIRLGQPAHTFELTMAGDCSGHWDPDRVAQICTNLIGNAIEHSTAASQIGVTVTGSEANVDLCVSSHGPTIPSELLARLFEPFRRARAAKRSIDGVGLGLHIVDQIVRAHGGTIAVQSQAEVTHFMVTLPRQPPATPLGE